MLLLLIITYIYTYYINYYNIVINLFSFNEYADKNTMYIRQFQQLLHYAGNLK